MMPHYQEDHHRPRSRRYSSGKSGVRRGPRALLLFSLIVACQEPAQRVDTPAGDTNPARVPAESMSVARSDSTATIGPDGWGPLRIGMARAQVVAAAGEDANPSAVGGPNPDECDQFRPVRTPQGLLVMLEDGILTRISLSEGTGIRTASGIGVGDPASAVMAAHGAEAVTTPHKYQEAPARYIAVWRTAPPSPDARGIVYEIGGDDRVMHIHAGGSSIEYVEGCL
jgi:hypothetical protein